MDDTCTILKKLLNGSASKIETINYNKYFLFKAPEHWGEHYDQCNGKQQSPIDIKEEDVTRCVLPQFTFENFHVPASNAKITNNGHTGILIINSFFILTIINIYFCCSYA